MVGPTSFGYQIAGFGGGVVPTSGQLELIETKTGSGVSAIDFTSIKE